MKVKLRKDALMEVLEKAIKFQDPNNVIPVCENFLIQGNGETLTVRATDSVSDFTGEIKNGTTDVFCIIVNAVRFFQTVKDFRNNVIVITITDKKIVLSSDKSKYNLPVISAEEFPISRDIPSSSEIHIKSSIFKMMVGNCKEFIAGNEAFDKLQFTGVYMACDDTKFVTIGTDGNIVCYATCDILSMTKFEGVIVGEETCAKAILISGTEESIEISSDGKSVKFVSEIGNNKFTYISSVLEYKYPFEACKKFFANTPEREVLMNSVELRETVKRVYRYSNQDSKTIVLNISKENIIVQGEDLDKGVSGEEEMTLVENSDGHEITISFNGAYITRVVNQIEEENSSFLFTTHNKPAYILPLYANHSDSEFKYMIAPVLTPTAK